MFPLSKDEYKRLAVLRSCQILDTSKQEFNDVARLATQLCAIPIAAINFVDADRVWIKGKAGIDMDFMPRANSFCSETILQDKLLIISDAQKDQRFINNFLVTSEPYIRFYAGMPLIISEGHAIGTLCLMDNNPHDLSAEQQIALSILARQLSSQIDLRLRLAKIEQTVKDAEIKKQTVFTKAAFEWRMTFDALETPVLLLTIDGKIARLNRIARELIGQDYEDIIGSPVDSFSPHSPWNLVAEILHGFEESPTALSRQVCDNENRTWDISIKPYIQSEDNEIFMVVVLQDVTERIRLEDSLRRSETMSAMGRLVAGVAHEVRNPLFSISATLDAFEARFGVKKEYETHIRMLRTELKRMTDLMQELLDYGKPQGLELSRVNFSGIIAEAVRSCELLAKHEQVEICNEVKDEQLMLTADRLRLPQVFQNLLENAIQHSPANERVTIEARLINHNGNWLECTVKDRGEGFQHKNLEKVFEPFFTQRHGGTGLGLSIVQRIVEEHGGRITAGNSNGVGAVVTVLLPVEFESV